MDKTSALVPPSIRPFLVFSLFILFSSTPLHADPLKNVSKRLAKVISRESGNKIAVLAFPLTNGELSPGSSIIQERLTTYFVQLPGVVVVERRLLNEVLNEIKLQNSGIISPGATTEIGRMLGVDAVVSGTLNLLPKGKVEINARLIQTESGRVLSAEQAVIKRTWEESPVSVVMPPDNKTKPIKPPEDPFSVMHAPLPLDSGEPIVTNPQLLNIDFGVWAPAPSREMNAAATGKPGDYWNTVAVAWSDNTEFRDLKFADGKPSSVAGRLINLGGAWSADGSLGVKDLMLTDYNYPQNNQGGESAVVLKNIPPGVYDLYLYGHLDSPTYYGDYVVRVGSRFIGRRVTLPEVRASKAETWQEGLQYVRFRSVEVKKGELLSVYIRPGGKPFYDTLISGLQLEPVEKRETNSAKKVVCSFTNLQTEGAFCYSDEGETCEIPPGATGPAWCPIWWTPVADRPAKFSSTCGPPARQWENELDRSTVNLNFDCSSNSYAAVKGRAESYSGAYWQCEDGREFYQSPGGACLSPDQWRRDAAAVCKAPCSSGLCELAFLAPFRRCGGIRN